MYAFTALGGSAAVTPSVLLAAGGLLALAVFVRRSLRGPYPLLQLRLVSHPVMMPGLLSVLLAGASMLGAVLLLPLWFQLRLGLGSVSTGLLLVPLGLGTTLIMLVAGRLTDRYGGGTIALAGSLVVLAATAPFPWLGPSTPVPVVQALLVVRGAGQGLTMMPAMTAAYASVRTSDLGDATALANIAMRTGGALGGALCVLMLSRLLATGGMAEGFAGAFAALWVVCALATASTAWLRHAETHHPQERP